MIPSISTEYAAGLFDGEGTIGVYWMGSPSKTLSLSIRILMQTPAPLFAFKLKYQGSVLENKIQKNQEFNTWTWYLYKAELQKAFLTDVLPYLLVKQAQVEYALLFLETIGHRGEEITEIRQTIKEAIQALNHNKGKYKDRPKGLEISKE